MPIELKYKCPDCGWKIKWIYDDETEELQPEGLLGCPGKGCTRLHEISARNVPENKRKEILNDRFVR